MEGGGEGKDGESSSQLLNHTHTIAYSHFAQHSSIVYPVGKDMAWGLDTSHKCQRYHTVPCELLPSRNGKVVIVGRVDEDGVESNPRAFGAATHEDSLPFRGVLPQVHLHHTSILSTTQEDIGRVRLQGQLVCMWGEDMLSCAWLNKLGISATYM